jgi:DNA-binding HxlR family transcriptional regulator
MVRAGAYALTLLSVPLNVQVLTALEDGPMALGELRQVTGSPPPTTTRKQLRILTDLGILERRRQAEFPGSVEYILGSSGIELLEVVRAADSWLQRAPYGPLRFGTLAAKNSLKALVDGWTSAIVRALATRDLTLTELDRLIPEFNYPSLERRLSAMRSVGLVHTRRAQGRGSVCVVDDWLRSAVAPLAAAARWERRRTPAPGDAKRLTPLDIEAMILLSVPPLSLPKDVSGSCRLAIQLSNGAEPEFAGALIEVSNGSVVSCLTKARVNATSWAGGSVSDWFDAVLDGGIGALEIGGDAHLARALLERLHELLSPGSAPVMSW